MGSVVNFANVVLRKLTKPLGRRRDGRLSVIHADTHRLLTLMGSILSVSGVRTKRLRITHTPFSLRTTVAGILTVIRPRTRTGTLALQITMSPVLKRTITSRHHFRRVLLGLLDGTVGFASSNRITLVTSLMSSPRASAALYLHIASAKVNVGPRGLSSLFRPFRRVSTKLTHGRSNAKLKLTVYQQLVRLVNNAVATTDR